MPTNIVVPELGESVVEATVARWLKREGERVSVGEPVVELETEKIDLEVGATRSGVLARITRRDGEDVKIGEVLGVIEEGAAESPVPPSRPDATAAPGGAAPATAMSPERAAKARATASARRLADEHRIDPSKVTGTGDGGRVTRQDVEKYIQAGPAPAVVPTDGSALAAADRERAGAERPLPPASIPPTPAGERALLEERVRMSRRRQTIARRLVEAQRTAAMLTTFNEVDMSAVMAWRRRSRESFRARHGVSLGIASFFVKASIAALRAFPRLNAEIQGDDIVLKRYYDIGIAVGAAEGLVVPVLRDADRLSFADIERGIKEFARKANEGGLTLEDLRGGTFTITNGGVFGSLLSTPILNPPQVGILGLHKIQDRAVPLNGIVTVRPMMYIALSYDHRIVDGLEAVQFLVRIKEIIEDPPSLLLA